MPDVTDHTQLGKLVRENLKTRKDYIDWYNVRLEFSTFNVTFSTVYTTQEEAEHVAKSIMERPQDYSRDGEYPEFAHVWKGSAICRYARRDKSGSLLVYKPN